jgi:hypothetical protein
MFELKRRRLWKALNLIPKWIFKEMLGKSQERIIKFHNYQYEILGDNGTGNKAGDPRAHKANSKIEYATLKEFRHYIII